MVSVYGNDASARATPNSSWMRGNTTVTEYMPEPPIVISPMSEKRDLEVNFKGRKFKFNDQELHGRVDKVKVIGLLREIADYPDKFNLIGLTAKDGYWEIGGAFADFIEKLYNESRAAQLQAKAA